ncbi:MAG TPA: ribose-5-phosphate isomerase RpiA [Kofleriaceae bacterium]|nr:ribose-5-phosphate isomerase RpiA [Kofleriaceae bacterium]
MTRDPEVQLQRKRAAAERAVEEVVSGMVVGLGAGSTAAIAMGRLAARVVRGEVTNVRCVPCSVAVGEEAARLGLALTSLDAHAEIDVTIDGADEVDPMFGLLKGTGGALLREKIVAQASRRELIVVDDSKLSPVLGARCALPVEVVAFGWPAQAGFLESLGARVQLRRAPTGEPYCTDQGNHILDCKFGLIRQPHALARTLSERAGIVEHGLFLDLAIDLVIADERGVRIETRGVSR